MSSRVSSMLVQQGLLAVSELQEALALQVVRGGTLGTILLERVLVPESTLIEILSQITGYPPIQPTMLDRADPAMREEIPEKSATSLCICPIARDQDRMEVLVSDATNRAALPELAYEFNRIILPVAATELRVKQAHQLVYGTPLSSRFTQLLERYGDRPASVYWSGQSHPTTEHHPGAPLDAEISDDTGRDSGPPTTPTESRSPPPNAPANDEAAARIEAAEGTTGGQGRRRATTDPFPFVVRDQPLGAGTTAPALPSDTTPEAAPPFAVEELESDPTAEESAELPPTAEAPEETGRAPLALGRAIDLLSEAADPDAVLEVLLHGAHQYLGVIQLYRVRGRAAQGRFALAHGQLDTTEIRQRLLDLEQATVVSRVVDSKSLFIGPAPDTDASPALLQATDMLAPEVAIVPVVMGDRTICLLLGHRDGHPISQQVRKPLVQLANAAAEAMARIILARRQAPQAEPVAADPTIDAAPQEEADSRERMAVSGEIGGGAPVGASERPDPEAAPPPIPEERTDAQKVIVAFDISIATQSTEELVAALDTNPDDADDILAELRRRGKPAMAWLLEQFPGQLRFGTAQVNDELPPVDQCSAVLQGLSAIGRPVVPRLAPLLIQGDDQIRFFATYLLSRLTYPEVVSLLAERLNDTSTSVRRAAIYGLRRCRELDQFPRIVEDLRADLAHPDMRPQQAAMEALAALGDVVATPSLIALLRDERSQVRDTAHRSLVMLTRQDFARDVADWMRWWNANRHRHRIEWLIDALVNTVEDVRAAAAIELQDLTGVSFGFDPSAPDEERERLRRRYLDWWTETGVYDFARFA